MRIQFGTLQEALNMGGHGTYVWLAVVGSILILLVLVLFPLVAHRRVVRDISMQERNFSEQLDKEELD